MATANDTCEVCGLEDFALEDGFYYCTECGTKLHSKREIVDDDIDVGCHTTMRTEVQVGSKISSWEQMNYFLHGLTERLVELGAPEELKMTVLQIWSAYLNNAEIAFFHKRQRKRPRLTLRNLKLDLKVMFNRSVPKRSIRRDKKSGETSIKRGRKRTQDMLKAEQDELTQSQNSDLESTLSNLSTSMRDSNSVQTPLGFQFNRRTRKRLLEELQLDEDSVQWHEQETPADVNCHTFPHLNVKRYRAKEGDNWSFMHRKSILIGILTLGLNQVRSTIQAADLIRWIEEGHLPFHDLRQYLPEGLDPDCYSETLSHLSCSYHGFVNYREVTSLIATDLGIMPIHPDLSTICYRFLSELALPLDLAPYIDKVIAIAPAIKPPAAKACFPKYELHAMKFILFVMKLLFGLDGVVETKLDLTTEKLNERIGACTKIPQLFVWREWQRYVTMRHVILEQLHYPTSHSRTQSTINRPIDNDLFLSFFETHAVSDDDNTTGYQAGIHGPRHTAAQERLFKNLHTIISSATEKHPSLHGGQSKKHIEFNHSLEPQRTYFAEILKMDDTERQHVYIPEYMLTDHNKRMTAPFVNPMPLKKQLLANQKIRLITKKIKPTIKHIQMVAYNSHLKNVDLYLHVNKFAHVLQREDDSESSSSENGNAESNILDYINSKAEKYHLSHEEILHDTLCQNTIAELESNLRTAQFKARSKDAELVWLKELKDEVNPFQNNPTVYKTLPDKQCCSETIKFALPNYYYWVKSGNLSCITLSTFEQDYFSTFPASFQFLLREAAYVTRCSMMDLYSELNELEKHIFKIYDRIK
ncbi:TATA box-binding protein-associated factor RNA polymerase I subunit B [Anopheles marshallii]|uniref:TATA box-binding protein-associated factor RNA polymerase I subunit B n=1 Tax=Anopheles marshallii TaxID=1521116 RepID=UPI00237C261B|nr:TATA box-binding protein-associated factor RNA polymerase I subunit B [Anopheles marshallii]